MTSTPEPEQPDLLPGEGPRRPAEYDRVVRVGIPAGDADWPGQPRSPRKRRDHDGNEAA
jgi:hypothetical protein